MPRPGPVISPKTCIVSSSLPFRPFSGFEAKSLAFYEVLSGFLLTLHVVYSIVRSPRGRGQSYKLLLGWENMAFFNIKEAWFLECSLHPPPTSFKAKKKSGFDLRTRVPEIANADLCSTLFPQCPAHRL